MASSLVGASRPGYDASVAKLLYTVNTSLDGYIEDTESDFRERE